MRGLFCWCFRRSVASSGFFKPLLGFIAGAKNLLGTSQFPLRIAGKLFRLGIGIVENHACFFTYAFGLFTHGIGSILNLVRSLGGHALHLAGCVLHFALGVLAVPLGAQLVVADPLANGRLGGAESRFDLTLHLVAGAAAKRVVDSFLGAHVLLFHLRFSDG